MEDGFDEKDKWDWKNQVVSSKTLSIFDWFDVLNNSVVPDLNSLSLSLSLYIYIFLYVCICIWGSKPHVSTTTMVVHMAFGTCYMFMPTGSFVRYLHLSFALIMFCLFHLTL